MLYLTNNTNGDLITSNFCTEFLFFDIIIIIIIISIIIIIIIIIIISFGSLFVLLLCLNRSLCL